MSTKKLLALRAFATDYHSGQWSRGYKLLSMTMIRLEKKAIYKYGDKDHLLKMARHSRLYKYLVDNYGGKI